MFVDSPEWTKDRFLDSPLSNRDHRVGNPLIPCVSHREDFYREQIKLDVKDELISILDRFTVWAGEPVDIRGDKLRELLSIGYDEFKIISEIINSNDQLKDFYL